MRHALALLRQSRRYAQSVGRSLGDFALEARRLEEAGLSPHDLRWLLCNRYVQQAAAIRADHNDSLLSPDACFVLTDAGDAYSTSVLDPGPNHHTGNTERPSRKPHWNKANRVLMVGDQVIKFFPAPAENQELVLDTFEELGWPSRIDDPIPPKPGMNAKLRLHRTIDRLNRSHETDIIRFRGDGTGRGVLWDFA